MLKRTEEMLQDALKQLQERWAEAWGCQARLSLHGLDQSLIRAKKHRGSSDSKLIQQVVSASPGYAQSLQKTSLRPDVTHKAEMPPLTFIAEDNVSKQSIPFKISLCIKCFGEEASYSALLHAELLFH